MGACPFPAADPTGFLPLLLPILLPLCDPCGPFSCPHAANRSVFDMEVAEVEMLMTSYFLHLDNVYNRLKVCTQMQLCPSLSLSPSLCLGFFLFS